MWLSANSTSHSAKAQPGGCADAVGFFCYGSRPLNIVRGLFDLLEEVVGVDAGPSHLRNQEWFFTTNSSRDPIPSYHFFKEDDNDEQKLGHTGDGCPR